MAGGKRGRPRGAKITEADWIALRQMAALVGGGMTKHGAAAEVVVRRLTLHRPTTEIGSVIKWLTRTFDQRRADLMPPRRATSRDQNERPRVPMMDRAAMPPELMAVNWESRLSALANSFGGLDTSALARAAVDRLNQPAAAILGAAAFDQLDTSALARVAGAIDRLNHNIAPAAATLGATFDKLDTSALARVDIPALARACGRLNDP